MCPKFELATLFTGRYIEIHVFPFSFQEYCQYYDDISDKDKLFDEYAIKGGLAGSYAYRTEKDRTNYIKEVYETIVTRDLVQKYTLPDTLVLQRLSEFLMDNISNLTVVFFPLVIRNITLPPILSDKKALITLAWDTLWLFLTIFEVCNHSGDREGMRAGYIAAFILMAGVWLVFWVARYLPVNGWIKAGTILIISCIWMAFTNDVYVYFAEHKKQLTILSTHFSDWTNHICVNANVCTLILIFMGPAFYPSITGRYLCHPKHKPYSRHKNKCSYITSSHSLSISRMITYFKNRKKKPQGIPCQCN